MSPRTEQKKIGKRPFSGQRFVEDGKVKIVWYVDGMPKEKTIGPAQPKYLRQADQILERALLRARAVHEGIARPADAAAPITLREVLDRHLTDAARRRSPRTGQPLRPDTLRLFAEHDRAIRRELVAELPKPAMQLRRPAVREVILRMQERGLSDKTVAVTADYLTQCYRWALDQELIEANPIAGLKGIPSRKGAGKPYTLDEVRRLLAAALADTGDQRDWRIRTLVILEAYYGARAGQIINLKWSDIDLDRIVTVPLRDGRQLRFTGAFRLRQDVSGSKGQAERELPIVPAARAVLLGAWNRRASDDGFVLWNWRDPSRPATYQGMNTGLRELERRAGVAHIKGRSFHAYRRGHATAVMAGVGAKAAADAIGDTVAVALKHYVKASPEDMAAGVAYMADMLAEPGLNRDPESGPEKAVGEAAAG